MKKKMLQNNEGISPVLGFTLILAIGVTLLTSVQLNFVPVWNTQEELDHIKLMQDDFKELKSNIESGIQSGTTLSSPLIMGFKYSPKMMVYNPNDEAYASMDISNNTWVEIRYNEVFPDGMTDETSIKKISTGMITYALRGAQNYNSFIYENGLIRRSGSDYTTNSQTLLANNTIFLPSLKALEYGTTSGVEKKTVNIYPTSQQKNSVIGKNVWLILHTDPYYVDWWETNLKKEGATVRKKDKTNGIVIANINSSVVIKMGEAYISTTQKASPPHSPAKRIVKVSGTGATVPVGGITIITVDVQDEYNNPVPNVAVSFSINKTRPPGNAGSTANLSQESAVSGTDGRVSVTLTTRDAGFHYIEASLPGYETTLVYSASSQGSILKLDPPTGSYPEYNVIATLMDSLGSPLQNKPVTFDTNDGFFSTENPKNTTDGTAGIMLNVSNATGIKIANIKVKDFSKHSANITWDTINNIIVTAKSGYVFNSRDVDTAVDTNGCVFYSTSPGNYSTPACGVFGSSHTAAMYNLLSGTPYYFIINANRPDGSSVNSTEYMFVTEGTGDDTPPANVTGLNSTNGSLNIMWTWIDPEDSDFDHVEIKINDEATIYTKDKGTQSFIATYLMPNSSHNISIRTVDTSNNKGSWVKHSASTRLLFSFVFSFSNESGFGIVTGDSNAQNDNDGYASAQLNETSTSGSGMTQGNTSVSSYIENIGTLGGSFANMQSASDGGAYATLTEAAAVTTQTNRTMNPGKIYANGTVSYTSSLLTDEDGAIDITIPDVASGAHAFDTKGQYQTTTWSTANPGTLSFTAGSGASVMVLTIFTALTNYRTAGTPTFNGKSFTSLGRNMYTSTPEGSSEMWYLLLTPADTGSSYTVFVPNAPTSRPISFHVSTFKSATGVSALDVNASKNALGINPSQSVTTTANGDVLVAGMFTGLNTAPTVTSPGTQIYSSAAANYKGMSQYYLQLNAGTQALGWTRKSNDDYSIQTAAFKVVPTYSLNVTYNFTETNPNSTWQSISINDWSYGDAFANVSILNSTSSKWESILTKDFISGTPEKHVNVIIGANGNASSYDSGGGQIKIRYNWTNSSSNNNLGIDLINVTVAYTANTYSLNITTNTTNVPEDITSNYYLEINYSRGTGESGYGVYVYDGNLNDWILRGNLTSPGWDIANFTLASSEIKSGNVNVLYLDQTPTGATQGNLFIDYQFVHIVTPAVPAGYHLDIRSNHTGIPDAASHKLEIMYNATGDNFTLQVYNGSKPGWDNKADLNITSIMTPIQVLLNADYLLNEGDFGPYTVYNLPKYYVDVRYVDKMAAAQGGKLYLDYQRVNSS